MAKEIERDDDDDADEKGGEAAADEKGTGKGAEKGTDEKGAGKGAGKGAEVDVKKDDKGEYVELELDEDERLNVEARAGAEDETADEKKARRRTERRERKERQRAVREAKDRRIEELQTAVQTMYGQLQGMGKHLTSEGRQRLTERIAQLKADRTEATRLLGIAVEKKDSDAIAKALDIRDQTTFELHQLEAHVARTTAADEGGTGRGEGRSATPDPRVTRRVDAFLAKHEWYNPRGTDEDSVVVRALDAAVAKAYDPTTAEYWGELEKRLKRYLPHRFTDADDEDDEDDEDVDKVPERRGKSRRQAAKPANGERRGPPLGSGRTGASDGKTRVYISPERKAAMIEAGAWDDPARRKAMLRSYAAWDRENARDAR